LEFFFMLMLGAPTPRGSTRAMFSLDGPIIVTCSYAEAKAAEAWLREHEIFGQAPEFAAAADAIGAAIARAQQEA